MPNGPTFVIDHSEKGDRNDQERTDIDFYEGNPPHGIYHRFQANNRGIIGDDVNTFPTISDMIRIPHRAVIRTDVGGKASNKGMPTVDEVAYIPAWAVGDPR